MDFTPFVNLKDKESSMYIEKIKSKNPKFYLTHGFTNQYPYLSVFRNCLGKLCIMGKKIGHHEARNPYNIGNFYDGFIYEFKIDEFPNCVLSLAKLNDNIYFTFSIFYFVIFTKNYQCL